MKFLKKEITPVAILLAQFFFILGIFIFAYRTESQSGLVLLILTNASVSVCFYGLFRYRLHLLNKKNIKTMTNALMRATHDSALGMPSSVIKDETGLFSVENEVLSVNNNVELEEYYKQLDLIVEDLRQKERNRVEILDIIDSVAVNMEFEKLLEDLLPKLLILTKSNCCAFYMANHTTNKLEIKHSIGFSKNIYSEFDLNLGDGFVGTATKTKKTMVYRDLPDDTVYIIRTFLGKIKPKNVMIVPILNQDNVMGTLVFASLYEYTDNEMEMVEMIKYYVGVAVGNGITYERTKRLTNELKFQNTLIQNMNEELEKKVADRTLFLNNIIDSLQDYAIYTMNKNGIITMWNKGAERLTGYTAEEVLNCHAEVLYPKEQAEIVRKRIETVTAGNRYSESGQRKRKDGTSFYYEMNLYCMYNDRGEVFGISNVTKDVSAVKQMENALSLEKHTTMRLMENSPFASVITDERGGIILANKRAELLFDDDGLLGQSIYKYFEDWRRMYEQLNAAPYNLQDGVWRYKLRDGGQYIDLQINVLHGEESDPPRILFTVEV